MVWKTTVEIFYDAIVFAIRLELNCMIFEMKLGPQIHHGTQLLFYSFIIIFLLKASKGFELSNVSL